MFVVGCFVISANAQEKQAKTERPKATESTASTDAKVAHVMLHRATEINGMKVRNSANKDLGTIKDTVIDLRSGEIGYAALSYGGFLGLGDKIFPVPWDALQHRHDVNDADPYFVLDIDEATLKRSTGFEDSKWPNFSDRQFTNKIDTFYEKFRKPRSDVSVTTPRAEVKVAVDTKTSAARDPAKERVMLRSSAIMGMVVKNEAQKDLGKVNDLVIEIHRGKIRYAALSYGGFLGLGDKLFAVPWKAFEFRHDISEKEFSLVLNIDEARLRKATGFDNDKWPNFADAQFSGSIDKHYDKFRHSTSADNKADSAGTRQSGAAVAADQSTSLSDARIHRASKIMDMEVRNQAGTKLGEVDDLVIDMNTGKVRYAALSYGGFLGLGDKLFAVPWSAFKTKYDTADEEHFMVVNLDEATLRKGSGFNKDAWPNFADSKITSEIDKHYGVGDSNRGATDDRK
jgi:sporulation protein YlmC with PRC-barrel domain